MMYQKAILFGDCEIAHQILETTKPAKQKSLGRKVRGFGKALWDAEKERIVEEGNWHKFSVEENSNLKKLLLDTGEKELVEVTDATSNQTQYHATLCLLTLYLCRLPRLTGYGVSAMVRQLLKQTVLVGGRTCSEKLWRECVTDCAQGENPQPMRTDGIIMWIALVKAQ